MTDLGRFQGKRICVALSGGVDSVVLLHVLYSQAAQFGYSLCAVHCEHGIRGEESKKDARFVQKFCDRLGVPLYPFEADCVALAKEKKESLETAARAFRRGVFQRLIDEKKADYIATAHHLDDEAETVLFRLSRGTALAGVKGMVELNGFYFRPLLPYTKAEILRYAEENGLLYRTDETNFQTEYTRNKLRLSVLPELEKAVPGAAKNLARFALIAGEDDEYLTRVSENLIKRVAPVGGEDTGWIVAFSNEKVLFRRAVLSVLRSIGVEKDYTAAHLNGAFDLQALPVGSKRDLFCGVYAVKEYDGIRFFHKKRPLNGVDSTETECEISFQTGEFAVGMYRLNVEFVEREDIPLLFRKTVETGNDTGRILYADADKIPASATVRFPKTGDVFEKFGGGSKSLKKYLVDCKIPSFVRSGLPILVDGERVLAVFGVEIASSVKVTKETTKMLRLSLNHIGERK